jgi:hypothetical protein
MKQIYLKMALNVADTLLKVIGIGYANDPDKLKDGSGFCVTGMTDDPDVCMYWIGCDETIYDAAIAEMLSQGLTITFPPPVIVPVLDQDGNPTYDEHGLPITEEQEGLTWPN